MAKLQSRSCGYRFRLQLFAKREVVLTLLYVLLTIAAMYSSVPVKIPQYVTPIVYILRMCAYPIAGCLGGNWCSRYKLIKISMWLIWVSVVINSTVSIIFYERGMCMENENSVCKGLMVTLQFLLSLGLAGFISNIIQFGMDQLQDASTTEITSFIVWLMWAWGCGYALGVVSLYFCGKLKLVATLITPISVSLALCLDSLFNHWLLKEPAAAVNCQNSFKLFFGVLRYAIRNKYPHQRSAFTYWEDKPYSRIDLAKNKYGGPFTTEQVEDVKILIRIFLVLTISSLGIGFPFTLGNYDYKVLYHLGHKNSSSDPCYTGRPHFGAFVAENFHLFFIPFHEFVLYPIFRKHILEMKSTLKFHLGLLLLILHFISLLAIEAVGYHYTEFPDRHSTCFLKNNSVFLSINYKWYYISQFLQSLGMLYVIWGILEFIYSQAPYAMKGLVYGSAVFLFALSYLSTTLLLLPVSLTVESWQPVLYGCGVWFYMCVTVFFLVLTLVCIIVFKKVYKMRRRDEDLHNRQIFAINYYSH